MNRLSYLSTIHSRMREKFNIYYVICAACVLFVYYNVEMDCVSRRIRKQIVRFPLYIQQRKLNDNNYTECFLPWNLIYMYYLASASFT